MAEANVFANNRSIVHAGDGGVQVCALPDVCYTPSPTGPVPVPYPNIAQNADLAGGSQTVTIAGHPVALAPSYLRTSAGNEAGSAGGGVVSGETKGRMTWATASGDVFIEGQGVVRGWLSLASPNSASLSGH